MRILAVPFPGFAPPDSAVAPTALSDRPSDSSADVAEQLAGSSTPTLCAGCVDVPGGGGGGGALEHGGGVGRKAPGRMVDEGKVRKISGKLFQDPGSVRYGTAVVAMIAWFEERE